VEAVTARALATALVALRWLALMLGALTALAFVLVVTLCVAPLLLFLDWRDRRRGVPEFRPEIMR
jgi:hypothetical protein